MAARHVAIGRPVHEAERRGIQALVSGLSAGYVVYSNVELPTGRRGGQTYEHDAVVIAPHCVFTVELKSWGGTITGNRDRWTLADGTQVQSPIPLVQAKARTLKGSLQARRRDLAGAWVQGLVFVTAADATVHITPDYEDLVATVRDIARALTDRTWVGSRGTLSVSQRKAIEEFLADGKPRRQSDRLNDFRLLQRLPSEDRPYEAWLAEASLTGERRVLHVYTVAADSKAERERKRAHALREATLHTRLQGGPDTLRYLTYFVTQDDPQRIVLQFEDTTPLVPLEAWLGDHNPGLVSRLRVALRAARALQHVHERNLVHRRLSPDALLVSAAPEPAEVRLCAFDLARDLTGAAPTITGSSLGDPAFRCIAPEVLRSSDATLRSDLFSLGATLYELLAGRPLFPTVDDILRPLTLPALVVGDRPVPRRLSELVARLLSDVPGERPEKCSHVAEEIEAVLADLTSPSRGKERGPGDVVRGTYELKERLGRGATCTTWKAEQLQTGRTVVLKIARTDHAALLQEEARILDSVTHDRLVRFYNLEPLPDGNMLVLDFVDGVTATLWAGAGDPLSSDQLRRAARDLLGALGALHDIGWLHRDVKPDNVMLSEPEAHATLLDLGLARSAKAEGDLAVGSIRYKDPLVYTEGRWTAANDQFAAFVVLYELLTGAHPFGGSAPEPGQQPVVESDQLPASISPEVCERLVTLFGKALSPLRDRRPTSLLAASDALDAALAGPPAPVVVVAEVPLLRPDAEPDSPTSDLPMAARSHGALARLGIRTLAEASAVDPESARSLPNVGSKTVAELRRLVAEVRERWPDLEVELPREIPRFYPPLVGDPRPLKELGRVLTAGVKAALAATGVRTVGELAGMALLAVDGLPGVGPARVQALRDALRRVAGREALPETLDALDDALRAELGDRVHAALAGVLGLHDGVARPATDVAAELGVSRQRVSQAIKLNPLRAEGSVARHLATIVEEIVPSVGLAPLDHAVEALATRLPAGGRSSPLGYVRLGALLLCDDAVARDASGISLVVRPPWTDSIVTAQLDQLSAIAVWPPVSRRLVEPTLWDALPLDLQRMLVRRGASAAKLVDALLRLSPAVEVDRHGALYQPPVPLAHALAVLRPEVDVSSSAEALLAEAREAFRGVEDSIDLATDLVAAGFVADGDRWVDPSRAQVPVSPALPQVDPAIPRQAVRVGGIPPVVATLAGQVDRGGFRVVALPPANHHRRSRELAGWLGQALGAGRARYVHVDRVVLDALKHADLWKFVPYLEPRPDADWRLAHAECLAGLDAAVREAVPGTVTVLGQPALLGTMGLMDWLSGFYERARGGRHGLIVLAVPGGIHDDRVRLNERHNLPYTPDMAAVYLEETT
jgi:serine/threonine protein kinase